MPDITDKEKHPTIFVLQGAVKYYADGSMLELHTAISPEEWSHIVTETVKYFQFVSCLKKTAYPILNERWDEEDEWFRLQLELSVSRMRNIDAILVASIDAKAIKREYTKLMRKNSAEFLEFIHELRKTRKLMKPDNGNDQTISVSGL